MRHMLCVIVFCARVLPQIDKKAMYKAGMVQRVINEVEIQCRLKHPSILEVSYSPPPPQGLVRVWCQTSEL